jgi:hypothetical protein
MKIQRKHLGGKVCNLFELQNLAKSRYALICPSFMHKPIPAVVVLNMPGTIILRYIEAGLYIYIKDEK